MSKDLITKESEALEKTLKDLGSEPDVCFACGSGNIKIHRTNTLRKERALPRVRECLDCGFKYKCYEVNPLM